MSEPLGELVVKAALPRGAVWEPKKDGNYEKILAAIGDIFDLINTDVDNLRYITDPNRTIVLDDLERDYGIIRNDDLTEEERKNNLITQIRNSIIDGNENSLTTILQQISPDINVYQNNPPVDPQVFIDQGFVLISKGRGDTAGTIAEESWPLVFFVGGAVTRDGTGRITSIEELVLPETKESLFVNPILAYKSLHSWAAVVMVLGTKQYLRDAQSNLICDANGNNIYVLFNFDNIGILDDSDGNVLVDPSGDNLEVYF